MRKRDENGTITIEALAAAMPALFLAAVATLVAWRGLGARLGEHERFREARARLARISPGGGVTPIAAVGAALRRKP